MVHRTDIFVEVEAKLGFQNGTDGVFVAARVKNGGCGSYSSRGIFFFIFPTINTYKLSYDLGEFPYSFVVNINICLN